MFSSVQREFQNFDVYFSKPNENVFEWLEYPKVGKGRQHFACVRIGSPSGIPPGEAEIRSQVLETWRAWGGGQQSPCEKAKIC